MNPKLKTILGILMFIVLIGGAYFAYNTLSTLNPPDTGIPGQNNTETPDNNDISISPSQGDETDTGENDASQKTEPQNEDEEQTKLEAFDFSVYDSEGNAVNLSDFYGKPIIINFWATWCPYCVEEMPHFEESYKKYKDEINFLMIDCVDGQRETQQKAENFIKEKGFTFPVFFDIDLDAATTYEAYSLPVTVFIDKDGFIVAYQPGMLSEELLQKGIDLIAK